eukprot:1141183-Prorocentrum_minimum.AAC.2
MRPPRRHPLRPLPSPLPVPIACPRGGVRGKVEVPASCLTGRGRRIPAAAAAARAAVERAARLARARHRRVRLPHRLLPFGGVRRGSGGGQEGVWRDLSIKSRRP